jgi:hypothetical protein
MKNDGNKGMPPHNRDGNSSFIWGFVAAPAASNELLQVEANAIYA